MWMSCIVEIMPCTWFLWGDCCARGSFSRPQGEAERTSDLRPRQVVGRAPLSSDEPLQVCYRLLRFLDIHSCNEVLMYCSSRQMPIATIAKSRTLLMLQYINAKRQKTLMIIYSVLGRILSGNSQDSTNVKKLNWLEKDNAEELNPYFKRNKEY